MDDLKNINYNKAVSEVVRLREEKRRLIAAFKTVSQIISYHYGEDENEDSDRLNAAFDVLHEIDSSSKS